MDFVFLDESGDCGIKGSKYQITALMCTSDCKQITKIIRESKQRLLNDNKCARWLNKKGGEIKWSGFPDDSLLRRMLNDLSKLNICIYYIAFEKSKTPIKDENKSFIIGQLFIHIKDEKKDITKIIADMDYFKKHGRDDNIFVLEEYIEEPIIVKDSDGKDNNQGKKIRLAFSKSNKETYEKLKHDSSKLFIKVEHSDSKFYEELQALDLICGSIFTSYENNIKKYVNILTNGSKVKITGTRLKEK